MKSKDKDLVISGINSLDNYRKDTKIITQVLDLQLRQYDRWYISL